MAGQFLWQQLLGQWQLRAAGNMQSCPPAAGHERPTVGSSADGSNRLPQQNLRNDPSRDPSRMNRSGNASRQNQSANQPKNSQSNETSQSNSDMDPERSAATGNSSTRKE
jgi:hypothetical protein